MLEHSRKDKHQDNQNPNGEFKQDSWLQVTKIKISLNQNLLTHVPKMASGKFRFNHGPGAPQSLSLGTAFLFVPVEN